MDNTKGLAYDLRRSAIHEAGHVAVADHFGVRTSAELRANPAGGAGEPLVLGRTWMLDEMPSPEAAAVIALAGVVAEAYAVDPLVAVDEIAAAIEDDETHFSLADAASAGDWNVNDIADCVDLIRECWPEVQRRADELAERFNAAAMSTPAA